MPKNTDTVLRRIRESAKKMCGTRILVSMGLVLLLAACGPESRNSLFTEKNLVFDPALVGTWAGEGEIYTCERLRDKTYKIIHTALRDRTQSRYQAQLGQLGEFLFLDVVPEEPEVKEGPQQAHMFFRLWMQGDDLGVVGLDDDWVKKMIASGKIKLSYERVGKEQNDIVLTASTADLQAFVMKYAEDEQAFPEPMKLRRQK